MTGLQDTTPAKATSGSGIEVKCGVRLATSRQARLERRGRQSGVPARAPRDRGDDLAGQLAGELRITLHKPRLEPDAPRLKLDEQDLGPAAPLSAALSLRLVASF
jgi:hypothetical protein